MEKDVVISIKEMQVYLDAASGSVELITPGRLSKDAAGYTLTYQESELTGLNNTVTTIQVAGPQVTMQRTGEFNSQMTFQAGRRHLSMLNTPLGGLALVGVNTRRLSARMDDKSGDIEIDYAIEVDHSLTERNRFCLSFQEVLDESSPRPDGLLAKPGAERAAIPALS